MIVDVDRRKVKIVSDRQNYIIDMHPSDDSRYTLVKDKDYDFYWVKDVVTVEENHKHFINESNYLLITLIRQLFEKGMPVYFNFYLLEHVDGKFEKVHYIGRVYDISPNNFVYARDGGLVKTLYLGFEEADEQLTLKKVRHYYEIVNVEKKSP